MPENQPPVQPSAGGSVTFNYTLDQARAMYNLTQKPPEMTDMEWSIITNEGFREYIAKQLGIPYVSRQ